MSPLRFLLVGDDFVPARVLEEELREHLPERQIEFRARDLDPDRLAPYRGGDVDEAFGDPLEIARLAEDCHVLVTTFAPVTASLLDTARTLSVVACGRGGPVNVDIDAATERGVPVLFAPGRNAQCVAEFTLAAMIFLMRRIPSAAQALREATWKTPRQDTFEKPSGPELHGKRVGVIGYGKIGQRVARLVGAFGAEVLVFSPNLRPMPYPASSIDLASSEDLEVTPVTLEALLREADVVTIHARLPKGAPPILGREELAAIRRRPILVNTARAHAIDEAALVEALQEDRIAAACLDVFAEEPLPAASPLRTVDGGRLLLTPHVSGMSTDVPRTTASLLGAGIASLLRGERPKHIANPAAIERWRAHLA